MQKLKVGKLKRRKQVMKNLVNVNLAKYHVKRNVLIMNIYYFDLSFKLVEPSLQGIRTDGPNEQSAKNGSSVSRNKGRSITLKCLLEPETAATNEDEISWDYSEVGDYFTKLPTGTKKQDNQILIDKLEKVHNGYYRCSFDGVSFMVILRVRSIYVYLIYFV